MHHTLIALLLSLCLHRLEFTTSSLKCVKVSILCLTQYMIPIHQQVMSSQKGDFTYHTPRGNIQYHELCCGVINLLDTFTNLPGGEDLTTFDQIIA